MTDSPRDQLHMPGVDPLHGKRFLVQKRDGRIEEFNEARILIAIESAFKANLGLSQDARLPDPAQVSAKGCADKVVERVLARAVRGGELEVEYVQDTVEDQLMLAGHLEVARRYILYREKRRMARLERESRVKPVASGRENAGASVGKAASVLPELASLYRQAVPKLREGEKFEDVYRRQFDACLNEGEYWRRLSPELLEFDSAVLARGMRLERDHHFTAARLELLREHYLLGEEGRCFETPQFFWMRLAMSLALNENGGWEARALEFYEALSTFRFVPSHEILSGAGTTKPALATFTHSDSPSLWMEPWRRDVLETAGPKKFSVPDLFMQRVRQQGTWTLFEPLEASGLRDCSGSEFERRYRAYEDKAEQGVLRFAKRVQAVDLWPQIAGAASKSSPLHIAFKDAVHSPAAPNSCPTGAINLAAHISESSGQLDIGLLRRTVSAAVRMLDNAVDLTLYPGEKSRLAGLKYRAIGLGVAGFQEALARLHLNYKSAAAVDFADRCLELISSCTIAGSTELAAERGRCESYADTQWKEGILPIDHLARLARDRQMRVDVAAEGTQDWAAVRESVRRHGLRNCALMAATELDAPARLAGVTPAVDPQVPIDKADAKWFLDHAARRQKWMDRPQEVTLRLSEKQLSQSPKLIMQAWEKGLAAIHQVCVSVAKIEERKEVEARVLVK